MAKLELYYATNRNHQGDRWRPDSYGTKFSDDGMENLRFGWLSVDADDGQIRKCLGASVDEGGVGDGVALATYLSKCAEKAKIEAYREALDRSVPESAQPNAKLGSKAMFR